MEQSEIRQLLQAVAAGERSVEDALLQLKEAPFEDLGFAKLDHHRALRQGAAEVIYGAGKTPEQIKADSERDHWMTADEAQAYGLVDKVIYKR